MTRSAARRSESRVVLGGPGSLEGVLTRYRKSRKSRPAKAAGDTTSSVFEVVDLRTPSPLPITSSAVPLITPPTKRRYTARHLPFIHALSPDSTSSPERDIVQTPAHGLPPVVRVVPTRPTWVVNTPTPPPRPKSRTPPNHPGVSRALEYVPSSEEDETHDSPLDRLGKTLGSPWANETSESAVDQLASGIESASEQDKGVEREELEDDEEDDDDADREDTPWPTPLPRQRSKSKVDGTKAQERDLGVGPYKSASSVRSRSPILGPAFDIVLPDYQAARRREAHQPAPTPTNQDEDAEVQEAVTDRAKQMSVDVQAAQCPQANLKALQTPITSTKLTLTLDSPDQQDSQRLQSTPSRSSTSTKLVEDLLNIKPVGPQSSGRSHTLCPCIVLDLIARLAASCQGETCEGCGHALAKEGKM